MRPFLIWARDEEKYGFVLSPSVERAMRIGKPPAKKLLMTCFRVWPESTASFAEVRSHGRANGLLLVTPKTGNPYPYVDPKEKDAKGGKKKAAKQDPLGILFRRHVKPLVEAGKLPREPTP